MAKTSNVKLNLGYLGDNYQHMLVKYFIEKPDFFSQMAVIIDQNMFTDDHLRRIVGMMKDRYTKIGVCCNYSDIEVLINSNVTDAVTKEIMLEKLKLMMTKNFDISTDIISENAEKFFKQQNIAKAINQCNEILRKGNADGYYTMEEIIKKALDTNTNLKLGFKVFDCLEDDLRDDYRRTIPTGADKLDESLYGGLGRGELGIIISPLGVGKSSATTGFAAAAATCKCHDNDYNGYKVLHFFFEDTETAIRRKYFGYITDIEACDLSEPQYKERALKILTDENNDCRRLIKENIACFRLASGEYSASDIKYIIQQYISRGFIPDMVIIDYFECIKPEKRLDRGEQSSWEAEGVTMRKLESMAKEFNVALWVPVQSTKGAIGQEYVGLADGGGSVKKTQIGHVIIQFAQTPEQKEDGRMSVFIGKLRAAKIGRTKFPNIRFNNGTCKFDMSDLDSYDNEPISEVGSSNNGQQRSSSAYTKESASFARSVK